MGCRAQVIGQISRLRQAWNACRGAEDKAAQAKRKGIDEQDMDHLLSAPELSDIKDLLYARHASREKGLQHRAGGAACAQVPHAFRDGGGTLRPIGVPPLARDSPPTIVRVPSLQSEELAPSAQGSS